MEAYGIVLAALAAAGAALAAYRLGLRDGLWQSGRTLPGLLRRKPRPDPAQQRQRALTAKVDAF